MSLSFSLNDDFVKNFHRISALTNIFTAIGCIPLFDQCRVDNDFLELKNFLNETRYSTIYDKRSYIVRFEKKHAGLYTLKDEFIRSIPIPTLNQVNFQTTLGDNTIVFQSGGTHEHNTRIHGGDIRLRSWLGFSKNIAVNCNGYVKEGVYPE